MSLANCNKHLIAHDKAHPRTCAECQLGPCKYPDGFFKTVAPAEAEGISAVHGDDPSAEKAEESWSRFLTSCSVRVMRSFDYSHFEVVLGGESKSLSLKDVDDLRKHAARLADKAVEQYKIAKEQQECREALEEWTGRQMKADFERIDAIAETDRTPEQKAEWKRYKDLLFQASRSYDYHDDWEDYPDSDDDDRDADDDK